MGDIKPLPEAIRNSVRSAIILFDMTRVVEELIFNSLDAGATKISVAVGAETCYLKVADNGCGITRDGLVLLAERYASSKFNELADSHAVARSFGFRGEALSSIASVSLLEVLTKAQGRPNAYRKVMKGCKCLYVGIDDGRQDVGTTVIVRDLFYNQPVRRKLIHSSPKKVLESVTKCVLRISLVHPNVFFKVVNIESDDELFCASSSSSPLSKLMSCFGVEVANSLHEMNVTAGLVKLSGYMSSPYDISSAKAFQYVYINSRYISKGTIHKLLNQLASSIRYLQHPKVNVVSQTAKRSKCQTCCTFILNLCCPRSWYDITFEPSKTSVEFKDWKPIIDFIEKAITRFWSEIVSHGDALSAGAGVHVPTDNVETQAAHTSSPGEDLPAKFRADKRKNRVHNHASPIAFPSPSLKMPSQKDDHVDCPKENTISCLATTYQRDSFFKSFDESPSMSGIAVDQEFGSCDWEPDYNVFSNEDQLVENKFLVPENFKKQVNYFSKSGFDEEHHKVDARLTKGHLKTDILGDPFETGNVDNMSNDFGKSFLQSCTSWKRRALEEDSQMISEGLGASLTNNYSKSDLPIDSFKNGTVDNMSNDFGKTFLQSCTSWKRRVLDEDSQMTSEGLDASLTKEYLKSDLPIDPFENGNVDNMSNDFGKPFLQSCTSRKKRSLDEKSFTRSEALEFPIENLRCKRTNRLPGLNFSSKASVKSSLSGGVLHRQNDFLVETDSDFRSRSHGFDDFDENSWRGYEEYDSLAERGFMDLNHFDDIVWNTSSRDSFSSLSRVDTCSDFKKYAHTEEDNFVFHPQHSLFDVTLPRSSDMFIDETKRLSSDFCGKYDDYSCAITSPHKIANDKDQISIKESFWKSRPRRSHSAPPFHRGRKKAFVLNNHLAGEAEKAKKRSVDLVTSQEVGKLKHLKRSSALCPLDSESNSMKDLLVDTRESKKGPGTCGVEKVIMKEKSEGLQFNCITLVEDIQDPVPELKWRDYSKTASGDKTRNPQNEETILDVSSGLLHLAGDLLVPKSNSRNFLNSAKVLQQVDKKFIPVVGNGVLAVIDQHAADERIRLEELRQKVLAGEKKTITYLDVEQKLVMPEMGYQLLHTYAEQIQNWGWLCDFHSQDSRSFKKNLSFLHKERRGITLTAVPCVLGVNLTDVDLLEFLQQLADTDGSSTIPPSVHRVLNSKACRGAIMFGDTLLPSECSLIVEELKQTSLCFQCAHGRPTTVPLINLKALHKQIEKLGSWNKNSGMWHGLRRHIPSLERATDRLSSNEVQCS